MSEERRKKILENANNRLNRIAEFNGGKGLELEDLNSLNSGGMLEGLKNVTEIQDTMKNLEQQFANNFTKFDDLYEKNKLIVESLQNRKATDEKMHSIVLFSLHLVTFLMMVGVIFDDLFNQSSIVQKWNIFYVLSCLKYAMINMIVPSGVNIILEWLKSKNFALYLPCFAFLSVGTSTYKAFKDYSTLIVLYVVCYYLKPMLSI